MKIIITGGTSGIGKSFLKSFKKDNHQIYNFSRGNNFDLLKDEDINSFVENVNDVDILIHSAGYNQPMEVKDISKNVVKWRKHFEINYLRFVELFSLLLEKGKLKENATIICLSSKSADLTREGWSGYCSSKAALNSFIRNYAQEDKERRIIGVSPRKVYTKMIKKLYPDIKPEDCLDSRVVAKKIIEIVRDEEVKSGSIVEID